MSRWRQGWELTKKSWAVLKSHRELLRFPIYGALLAIALVIVLVGPGVYLIDDGQNVIGGLLVAIGLYGASFVSVYFGVALAAAADMIFQRPAGDRRRRPGGRADARRRDRRLGGAGGARRHAHLGHPADGQHRRGDRRLAGRRRLGPDHLPRRSRSSPSRAPGRGRR